MPIDYSKWKDIEVSDDEDDTHPNIDTPSLFKWRHEARLQRQKEFDEKKRRTEADKAEKSQRLKELKEKVSKMESTDPNMNSVKKALTELEDEMTEVKKRDEEVKKEEKLRPWNVDTISTEGFNKTLVNSQPKRKDDDMTPEEKENYLREFVKKYEKDIDGFGWLNKWDDSRAYLLERTHLACEETANYLVIKCINLAMEEKFGAMDQVAHQTIAMQYLLELSKQLDVDPRACISSFFSKIQKADPEYMKAFEDELSAFKDRIRRRAQEKIEEQMEELRKEDRKSVV